MSLLRKFARPPSNIRVLEKMFDGIILDSRDGDGSGMGSTRKFTRHTFVFKDGSRLLVYEEISNNLIEVSHYTWIDEHGNEILRFDSEPHDDPRYQTETEPYHIHPPEDAKLTNRTRYPNFYHQELDSIMEHIFLTMLAAKKI